MKKLILIITIAVFLFSTCALEIANVIGPGGGFVFFDKGNYDNGWRYIECRQFDIGELSDLNIESIERALKICDDHSGGWYRFPWEIPTEADLKKMLECFKYGLTRFSSDYYYLALNKPIDYEDGDGYDSNTWEAIVLHKSYKNKVRGEVLQPDVLPDTIRIRPIRRF